MGRQAGPNYYTGRVGNRIGYKRNGVYFERMAPEYVEQSPASQKAALYFGLASKTGKFIRRALLHEIDLPWDGTITNRITKTLAPAIQTASFSAVLQGFCFNNETPLERILEQTSILQQKPDGTFLIKVPAQHFNKKPGTHLELKAVSASIHFAKQKHEILGTDRLKIDIKKTFKGAELMLPPPGRHTTIIILQVLTMELVNGKYYEYSDRKYCSAEIIKVIPEQALKTTGRKKKSHAQKKTINKRRPPNL